MLLVDAACVCRTPHVVEVPLAIPHRSASLCCFTTPSPIVHFREKDSRADRHGEKGKSGIKEKKSGQRVSKPLCYASFNRCYISYVIRYIHLRVVFLKLLLFMLLNDVKQDMFSKVEMEAILTLIITVVINVSDII